MVDGDLSHREETALARHIETCPECAALYQAFSAISSRIGEDLEPAPFDLRDNVMAEIQRAEIRRRNRIPNILRSILSVAACVALIFGVYLGVSITQGKNLVTSAFDLSPVSEQKVAAAGAEVRELPEEAAPAAVAEEAAAEPADAPQLQANAAPAMTEHIDAVLTVSSAPEAEAEESSSTAVESALEEAPAAEALEDASPAEEEAPEEPVLEEWELRNWDLSLLRQLLNGSPDERSEEELASGRFGQIRLVNFREEYQIPLYELDGVLYYLDPVEETVFRSALSVQELRDFLGA